MNQHQTERVRSYLRGRLQLAILQVYGGVGGFIVAPLGQATGNGDYYPSLEELAARHGVTIPESIMHGPLDHTNPIDYPYLCMRCKSRQRYEWFGCEKCGHRGVILRTSDTEEQNTPASTIERAGTQPMRVHKSLVVQFLRTHPDEREQVIPGWAGTIEEYIAELERRPGQFFVNGELVEESTNG